MRPCAISFSLCLFDCVFTSNSRTAHKSFPFRCKSCQSMEYILGPHIHSLHHSIHSSLQNLTPSTPSQLFNFITYLISIYKYSHLKYTHKHTILTTQRYTFFNTHLYTHSMVNRNSLTPAVNSSRQPVAFPRNVPSRSTFHSGKCVVCSVWHSYNPASPHRLLLCPFPFLPYRCSSFASLSSSCVSCACLCCFSMDPFCIKPKLVKTPQDMMLHIFPM